MEYRVVRLSTLYGIKYKIEKKSFLIWSPLWSFGDYNYDGHDTIEELLPIIKSLEKLKKGSKEVIYEF